MSKDSIQILLDGYWTSKGWRPEPVFSDEDKAIATDAGLLFPDQTWSHKEAVEKAVNAVSRVAKPDVARAFLIGLGSGSMVMRSAIGSYANGLSLRPHPCRGESGCDLCGIYPKETVDFNILNFERYKFGGVRHHSPEFIAFDLDQFKKLDISEASSQGLAVLRSVLDAINLLPPEARASDAVKAITPYVEGNNDARRSLLETLGYCGVLRSKGTLCVWEKFYSQVDRDPPPKPSKNDWSFPVSWWTRAEGVDHDMARYWFGEFGLN